MSARAVSVVVCTDGRLSCLKTTLRALRGFDYAPFELVLVVGPTPDGTQEFAATLRGEAKIAACPDRNLSRARNIGIGLAAGEIVAFLDDDAIPEPQWLAELAAAYDDPEVAAAGGIVYDSSGVALQARYVTLDRLGYAHPDGSGPAPQLNYPFSAEFPHLLGANCSFRRDALTALGGFDEEYEYFLDESDVLARLNDSGGRIAQLPGAAVHHKFAPSLDRDARRVQRRWGPLIKNRLYFGLRNGQRHHGPLAPLRAALEDAEQWRDQIETHVARGELTAADRTRFEAEALEAIAAGLAAARAPRRLTPSGPAPPPLRPFPTLTPEGGKLCLCLLSQDYPPDHNGGVARNAAELAAAWARLGHDVHVFTRAHAAPSLDYENGVWVHRRARAEGGRPPDLGGGVSVPQPLWDHARTMRAEVERLAAQRRIDLVYAPLWDGEAAALLVEPRFPVVVALQTTVGVWLDSYPERRRDPEWMAEHGRPRLALERWCLERAPLLHANSRAVVEDVARGHAMNVSTNRLVYAPHGVSDTASPGVRASGPARFLFVGRLEGRKGIDTLLAAAPKALRRLPGARLDIVGDDTISGPDGATWRDAFLARADVADLADRIAFHGRVGEAQLHRHYAACDVLVAPSRYESFGLVYVEGMMHAKPVIAGRGGGGAEVVEHGIGGLLVPPGDAAALEAAMLRLGGDEGLRRDMGARSRARYEACFAADAAAAALLAGVRERFSARTLR